MDLSAPINRDLSAPPGPKFARIYPIITGSGSALVDIVHSATGLSLRKGGTPLCGFNFGQFDYFNLTEIPTVIARLQALGVTLVRLVGFLRWTGAPSKGDADSRNQYDTTGTKLGRCDSFYNATHPASWAKLKAYARALSAAGIWFIIVGEGDIQQSGTQDTAWNGTAFDPTSGTYDYSLTLPEATLDPIPGGLADWGLAGGLNLCTSPTLRGRARERAKMVAREFRSYDYYFAFEPWSEPLPPSGTISTGLNGRTLGGSPPHFHIYPGPNNDGVYTNIWTFAAGNPNAVAYLGGASTGPGNGIWSMEEVYRAFIADYLAIDPNRKFIVGGRGAYNPSPEGNEIISALSDASGPHALGGNLFAANVLILTYDKLDQGATKPGKTPIVCVQVNAIGAISLVNQLGARASSDPNDYAMLGNMRCLRSRGIFVTWWDYRGNAVNGYGIQYATGVGADGNGANGAYADVTSPNRPVDFTQVFSESLAAMETAAIAAANAAGGVLFYVKADRTNCTKSGGGVPAIGDAISQIQPVTDPNTTGLVFNAVGTITVAYPEADGSGNSYLPDNRPVLKVTGGAGNYLSGSIPYFGSTTTSGTATGAEVMAAIVAGYPGSGTGGKTFMALTNSGTAVRYPQLSCTSGGSSTVSAKCIGGSADSHTMQATNTTTASNPLVVTFLKSGTAPNTVLTTLVNGIDDTGTDEVHAGTACTLTAQTVSAISSPALSRFCIGATNNAGDWDGTFAGWCVFRQLPTAAQYHAIGKFLAALQGGVYKA